MIEKLMGSYYESNSYIITNSGQALIIDPFSDYELIYWKVKKLKTVGILVTHGHSDHIGGVEELAKILNCEVFIHKNEEGFLTQTSENSSSFKLQTIKEGDNILIGNENWEIIDTPGHSPGGISLYFPKDNILFCGDILFFDSIGRTDIYGSDPDLLRKTLKEKIFKLPEETVVYPGHGKETTIKREKNENAFLSWILK